MDEPHSPTPALPHRPPSESAWGEFVDSYGRAVLEWFRQTGLPPNDIHELVGELIAHLAREFAEMVKAPERRFRAWLQFAAHHAWAGLAEGLMNTEANGASPKLALLLSAAAHDTFLKALDTECSHL